MAHDRSLLKESKEPIVEVEAAKDKYTIASQFRVSSDKWIERCIALPNGCVVTAVGIRNETAGINVYDPVSQTCLSEEKTGQYCRDLFVLPDQRLLYNHKDEIQILDPATLKVTNHIPRNLRLTNATMWGNYFVCVENIPVPKFVFIYDFNHPDPVLVSMVHARLGLSINFLASLSENKLAIAQGDRVSILEKWAGGYRVVNKIFFIIPSKTDPLICALANECFVRIDTRSGGFINVCDVDNKNISEARLTRFVPPRKKLRTLPDGKSLISFGKESNELCIWDLVTLQPQILTVDSAGHINDFDILQNGNVVIAASNGLICIRLSHLLAHKVTPLINKDLSVLPNELASLVKDYLGGDIQISPEKSFELDGQPFRFFNPSAKKTQPVTHLLQDSVVKMR